MVHKKENEANIKQIESKAKLDNNEGYLDYLTIMLDQSEDSRQEILLSKSQKVVKKMNPNLLDGTLKKKCISLFVKIQKS